jgi:hypothetical protein
MFMGTSTFTFRGECHSSNMDATRAPDSATLNVAPSKIVFTQTVNGNTSTINFNMVMLGDGTFSGYQDPWYPDGYVIGGNVSQSGMLTGHIHDVDAPTCHDYALKMQR